MEDCCVSVWMILQKEKGIFFQFNLRKTDLIYVIYFIKLRLALSGSVTIGFPGLDQTI
jgi:hypothetical protein